MPTLANADTLSGVVSNNVLSILLHSKFAWLPILCYRRFMHSTYF